MVPILLLLHICSIHSLPKSADESKARAAEFWTKLNTLSRKDPQKYRETVAAVFKDAENARAVRKSTDFIHHAFHIESRGFPGAFRFPTRIYVNVLASPGIKQMSGDEVPMLLSRPRLVKPREAPIVYDIIVHQSTLDRAKADNDFQRALQDLFFDSIDQTYANGLQKNRCKLGKEYIGRWLWRDDGTQRTDKELASIEDMSVEDMLSKLHGARIASRVDEESGATPVLDFAPAEAEPDEELPQLVLPGQQIRRIDSKTVLIQEVGPVQDTSSASGPSPVAPVVEVAAPPTPAPPLDPDFVAQAPEGAMRCAYTPSPMIAGGRVVSFDLSSIFPADATWSYEPRLDSEANVLELVPASTRLPWLSVRFLRPGAQLLVGPRVLHPTTTWLGMPLPSDIQPRFSKKTRKLTVHTI
ncbi:hypothetical protein BC828DRAFT_379876 [Blastocladiella britannica]|nr:hypothetical protein BC828DRAFT_379876 [Blastocladiella britannica]